MIRRIRVSMFVKMGGLPGENLGVFHSLLLVAFHCEMC